VIAGRRTLLQALGASVVSCWSMPARSGAADELAQERAQMVAEIAAMARATAADTGRARFSEAVMDAMRKVPRHRFIPPSEVEFAYRNRPLPIGRGQTISQPYIVALTTDLIEPQKHHRVLEIGTGSGYQAAVLAELVQRVYSIEIVESLAREAQARLAALGYANVDVRHGDGHAGWPQEAPFDGIVVTAAAARIPQALVAQLKPGARMAIPVGPQDRTQDFMLLEKRADGSVTRRVVLPVMFVPMTGGTP
jgi:protein-L-isoaspartate(D-aspartate) O-methyltransferase